MKRIFFIILTLFLFLINISAEAEQALMEKEFKVVAKDGFNIVAKLTYPKIKNQKEFQTVVLLHSLGYNSQWWGDLPKELLGKGYAVLTIDLRGHGESVYNKRLSKISWKNMKNSAYSKYPTDVLEVINTIIKENTKRIFFDNWAIVGADIGASAGVLVSDLYETAPKTIVMISPVIETKGLYIPTSIAHLENVDILSISGTDDNDSVVASTYLSRFAQNEFMTFTSESRSTGMLMIKNDQQLPRLISEWIFEYLN